MIGRIGSIGEQRFRIKLRVGDSAGDTYLTRGGTSKW